MVVVKQKQIELNKKTVAPVWGLIEKDVYCELFRCSICGYETEEPEEYCPYCETKML